MADVHVLLVYSLGEGKLLHYDEFSSSEQDEAFTAYAKAEAEHRVTNDVEIVLVAADSIETIRHTHGSYFRGDAQDMDLGLEELLARA